MYDSLVCFCLGRYYYVDTYHFGPGAHIEVFTERGVNIGAMDLNGRNIIKDADSSRKINIK